MIEIDTLLSEALRDVGIDRHRRVALAGDPAPAVLASPLAVTDVAVAAVAACLEAAAELAEARGRARPQVTVDVGLVAAAVLSERWLRDRAGRGVPGFAPLSRLWMSSDGWVRTHANYPWHRAALVRALGVADDDDERVTPRLADAIAAAPSAEVEDRVSEAGGLAVAARTEDEWALHPAGRAVADRPLIEAVQLGAAPGGLPDPGALPATGIRVLDLTRVIAGPVATRMLGALGAEVLRIDPPNRPELPLHAVDGIVGKASALVDAASSIGRELLDRLVGQAHVVVTGYRPGALRRLGLEPDQIAERWPGTVVVTLSAWGTTGPWGTRRGFDSLVQVATGVGWAAGSDATRPAALPCQLLDHATGYLAAAAALAALAQRTRSGSSTLHRLSLARTAGWLLEQGVDPDASSGDTQHAERDATRYRVALGDGWTGIAPPGQLDGQSLTWPHLPPRYGQSPPSWDG